MRGLLGRFPWRWIDWHTASIKWRLFRPNDRLLAGIARRPQFHCITAYRSRERTILIRLADEESEHRRPFQSTQFIVGIQEHGLRLCIVQRAISTDGIGEKYTV